MRLREAGVAEATISDLLWHKRIGITAHYSTAQVREIYTALELIKDESGQQNRSLAGSVPSGPFSKEKRPGREVHPGRYPTAREMVRLAGIEPTTPWFVVVPPFATR